MPLHIHRNERCLRDLHWDFLTEPPVAARVIVDALWAVLGAETRMVTERWGERSVVRLMVPFEAEYQIGARDGLVELLHRLSANPETRRLHHERLRDVLQGLLDRS